MPKAAFYFPPDFRWGTATSSHQVEGNNSNNDWWAWEQQPGRILHGATSGLACNWWQNAEADFDSAAVMGTNAHRLSIEWSRVEPRPGYFDPHALDRYRTMLQALHQREIEPMVTLHHFTNPLWLAEMGTWEHDAVGDYFARYVRKVVQALGDLVPRWVTINEPMVYVVMAYVEGKFPPGKGSLAQIARVVVNLLKGHAAAYHVIHELYPQAQVGIARHLRIFQPANPKLSLDRWAAGNLHRVFNLQFDQALMTGRLTWPFGRGVVSNLAGMLDFYGLDYYTRELVNFSLWHARQLFGRRGFAPDGEMSDNHYGEVYPQGLFQAIKLAAGYQRPIYITENGLPDADDDQRPRFLLSHLRQVWAAIQLGFPVMGYYHWSLVDNFEWDRGWEERFGLIEMIPETQERRMRRSGELYGRICRTGRIDWELVSRYAPELLDELYPG